MRTSKASPVLFVAAASGKHIKTAQVSVRRAVKDTIEYLKIKLTDVLVSSFAESVEGAEGEADETLGFSFGVIEVQYTPQDPTGEGGRGDRGRLGRHEEREDLTRQSTRRVKLSCRHESMNVTP